MTTDSTTEKFKLLVQLRRELGFLDCQFRIEHANDIDKVRVWFDVSSTADFEQGDTIEQCLQDGIR